MPKGKRCLRPSQLNIIFIIQYYSYSIRREVDRPLSKNKQKINKIPDRAMNNSKIDDNDDADIAYAVVDLGTLEPRAVSAVDVEAGAECPVCLDTLVLNDPMRLPCKHLI